jgi:hypothetical protein
MKRFAQFVALTLLITACATTPGDFKTVKGRTFDLEKMEQVRAGMSLKEVMEMVGEPHLKVDQEEGTLYQYFMVREKLEYDKALGVFAVEKKTTRTDKADLLFAEDGFLLNKKYEYSVTRPKEKGEE